MTRKTALHRGGIRHACPRGDPLDLLLVHFCRVLMVSGQVRLNGLFLPGHPWMKLEFYSAGAQEFPNCYVRSTSTILALVCLLPDICPRDFLWLLLVRGRGEQSGCRHGRGHRLVLCRPPALPPALPPQQTLPRLFPNYNTGKFLDPNVAAPLTHLCCPTFT